MNHSNSNFSIASFFSGILALMFCGVAFFSMFAVAQIQNYHAFAAVVTFASINMMIIFILAICGRALTHSIPFASCISIWTVTVIYTLFQFIHLGLNFNATTVNGYILYQLIVLFVYLLITIPAALIGAKRNP